VPADRGSQYTSEEFQKLMTDHGINAAMERFFSSLKTERIARRTYRTRTKPRLTCSIN
jgi:putative transposase